MWETLMYTREFEVGKKMNLLLDMISLEEMYQDMKYGLIIKLKYEMHKCLTMSIGVSLTIGEYRTSIEQQ